MKLGMDVVNFNAAGIDVGSRSHYVAVGQELEDVREFGVYAEDLTALCQWLMECDVTTVAMESTGDYWQNLYTELVGFGFEVVLANGKSPKMPRAKRPMSRTAGRSRNYIPLACSPAAFCPTLPPSSSALIAGKGGIG